MKSKQSIKGESCISKKIKIHGCLCFYPRPQRENNECKACFSSWKVPRWCYSPLSLPVYKKIPSGTGSSLPESCTNLGSCKEIL